MKNVILFFSIFLTLSCSSNKDEAQPMVIDTHYTLTLVDVSGNNLLDPSYKKSFVHNKVLLYAADDKGNKTSNIYAKGTDIIKSTQSDNGSSEYYISINAGSYVAPDKYVLYLSLPNGDLDKLEMKFIKSGQSQIKSEIYYNDKLIWKHGKNNSAIVVIKHRVKE